MNTILLNPTIIPTLKEQLPRKHVNQMLRKGMSKSVVTVVAGAGYGKTQAVSSFLKNSDAHVIWFTLSQLDNLSLHFWETLCEVVVLQNPSLAEQMQFMEFPDTLSKIDEFLHLLARELHGLKRYVIVLDDLHLLENKQILWLIEMSVKAQIDNLTVVLISRTIPPINLLTLHESGEMVGITEQDLQFTLKETEDYLKLADVSMDNKRLHQIYKVTEGWPFSLYLITLALHNGAVMNDEALANTLPVIFTLIEQEIFSHYKPSIQKLLVKLALLDQYRADLVNHVAGDLAGSMPKLAETNMFITYNAYADSYHLHNLFIEFLKHKDLLSTQEKKETYIAMADYYKNNHNLTDALIYYKEGEDYSQCWSIIKTLGMRHCSRSGADFLLEQIEDIPIPADSTKYMMQLVRANLLLNNNQLQESDRILRQTEKELLLYGEQTPEFKVLLGETYVLMAILDFCLRRYQLPENFKRACKYLPNGCVLFDHSDKMIDSNYAVIMRTPDEGELKRMQQLFFEASPYLAKLDPKSSYGRAYLCRAEGAYFTGNFNEAKEFALQAVYRGQTYKNLPVTCLGYFILIRTYYAEGDYKGVLEHFYRLDKCTKELHGKPQYPLIADIAKGWLFSKLKLFNQIAGWLTDEALNDQVLPPISAGRDRIVRAQVLLNQNKYYEVLAFLNHSETLFINGRNWLALLNSQIIQAIAYYYISRQRDALRMLQAAYQTAKGNELYMAFIEYGSYMRTLTTGIRNMKDHNLPEEWLEYIMKKSSTYAKRSLFIINEYNKNYTTSTDDYNLTHKELAILQALCQGLTREEIAVEFGLSINTVKTKLQNIYGKLGALNAIDAVRIAYASNLIG